MGFGEGMVNLRSLLSELSTLNGNLVGSVRTGYKQSGVSFGDGGASNQVSNSLQYPDANLTVNHTSLDFGQGNITSTGGKTDFAISGQGFFLVQQIQDVVAGTQPNLLTRDGELHFADIPALGGQVLMTHSGLAVLRDSSGTGAGPYTPILKSDFDNNNFRPSIVMPNDTLDSLKFSNKGATVFEFQNGFGLAPDARLVEQSLESSNSDLAQSLTAMSLHTKKFAAMAAELKIEQTNLQTVIDLIK